MAWLGVDRRLNDKSKEHAKFTTIVVACCAGDSKPDGAVAAKGALDRSCNPRRKIYSE
jgi:hypothetical protein